jgi:hypothetical protein
MKMLVNSRPYYLEPGYMSTAAINISEPEKNYATTSEKPQNMKFVTCTFFLELCRVIVSRRAKSSERAG